MLPWKKILKGFKWAAISLVGLIVIGTIIRIPHVLEVQKTAEQVAKIHATKLTLADVMGDNLPPDPGAEADKTVAGIDANTNGIRDDVELAIFKEYPDSAKTRAVLLQYALAMQMQAVQSIINKEVVIAVIQEEDRASLCIADLVPTENLEWYLGEVKRLNTFIENMQLNNQQRIGLRGSFLKKIGSYSSLENRCDFEELDLIN